MLRFHGKSGPVEPVPLPGAPFSHYYAQEPTDEGIIMETDVQVKQVNIPAFITFTPPLNVKSIDQHTGTS